MTLTHRIATRADLGPLRALMHAAISELQAGFLTPAQIEASRAIMGLDTQLIDDGTYFVVHAGPSLAGGGGWSRRATLYGGDHSPGRDARPLDPATEPARIRAMYTDPAHVRRGVGRLVLALCEAAAAAHGFKRIELAGTLAGEPLYRAAGYTVVERFDDPRGGVPVPLLRMAKDLARGSGPGPSDDPPGCAPQRQNPPLAGSARSGDVWPRSIENRETS